MDNYNNESVSVRKKTTKCMQANFEALKRRIINSFL